MNRKKLWAILFAIVSIFIGMNAVQILANDLLKEQFRDAPQTWREDQLPLRGMPLWHTNGPLSSELIHEILEKGKENGFGGITFLPLSKTEPAYLSDEYFQYFGEVLNLAKKLEMKIIFYDDLDFPSGSAGWKLQTLFPEDTLKRLDKFEWTAIGPTTFREKCPIPLSDKAIYGNPAGVLQAAVAMNMETFERIDLTELVQEGEIFWDVPAGEWKIFLFVCVADSHGLVDYMSPKAVQNFMTLTYEQFYQRFPEHFGTTIPAVFFDDITNCQTEGARNWTLGFNEKYEQLFHRKAVLDYPALFYSIGNETPAARNRLWTTRTELFADGYPKVIADWCRLHGLMSTGHPQGPYVIQPLDMCGDAMLSHRASDAVLFDSIHYYGHGRDGFKVPTSAAFNFDDPYCFVEIYGNYRNDSFDDKMMYRSAMEIFCRGGNMLLPHGIWSDPATVYIPPEISWRNPALNGCLPQYGDFVSRVSLIMQHSRHVADIGIVYPIDSLKAFFHFPSRFITGDYPHGLYIPQETDYLAVGSDLSTKILCDFTFLHPTTIDSKCSQETSGNEVVFRMNNENNWEEYKVVLLTGADVISWSNLEKILAFYEAGGKVLATTHLPTRSSEGNADENVCLAIEKMFGIDPRTQSPNRAIRSGQEDIVLYENFQQARDINKEGEFCPPVPENAVLYEKSIFQKNAVFVPRPTVENFQTAVDFLLPVPDVKLFPLEGKAIPELNVIPRWDYPIEGMLQYIHKVKDGRDFYYFANSSNKEAEFDLQIRGSFQTLELWNPMTGEIRTLNSEEIKSDEQNGIPVTIVRLHLPSISSQMIVGISSK